MAAPGVHDRPPIAETQALVKRWADWFHHADDVELGKALIGIREAGIDSLEAVFAEGLRRFDKSGEYAADGALSIVPWLRWKCNLSGGAATERVAISRQLEHLPETRKAFAVGALGYQHVAGMARTAEHLGVTAVRKAESTLLQTAATMDPGRFTGVLKNFEHQVDAAGALAEANRAYERRYLRIGQPADGLVRLDGLLDAEGGSTLIAALDALMPPPGKHDQRTAGQRRADALIDLCVKKAAGSRDGAGPRPHLVLRASVETLAGTPGAAAGQFEWGGLGARRDRPAAGLRRGPDVDHWKRRAGSRNQPRDAQRSAVHAPGASRPGSRLRCRRLWTSAAVDRRASCPALG